MAASPGVFNCTLIMCMIQIRVVEDEANNAARCTNGERFLLSAIAAVEFRTRNSDFRVRGSHLHIDKSCLHIFHLFMCRGMRKSAH